MAYQLEPQPGDGRPSVSSASSEDSAFQISAEPVVETAVGPDGEGEAGQAATASGSPALHLMARDPHSLFAYWHVDWTAAFRGRGPRDRKVHLRITRSDGGEETTREVEPLAGSCNIEVATGDESYMAELGYFEPENTWNRVAVSSPVVTPPDTIEKSASPDFSTVPFHISFQRMIDLFRVSKHEGESLTAMLAALRKRAEAEPASRVMTEEEREIVRAIDDAAGRSHAAPTSARSPDLWVEQGLERVLGFGARGTSPEGGRFTGSSRPA